MRAAICAGGRRVATPDMPDVFRHSLTDPDPEPRHSMSDPRYTYTKTFGGAASVPPRNACHTCRRRQWAAGIMTGGASHG